MEQLDRYLIDHTVFFIKDFADLLPKELIPTLDEAFLWDIADLVDDEERIRHEWSKALVGLKRANLRRRIAEISRQLVGDSPSDRDQAVGEELRVLTDTLKSLDNPR